MERFWQAAAEIASRQAGIRVMSDGEIVALIRTIAASLYEISVVPVEELKNLARSSHPTYGAPHKTHASGGRLSAEEAIQGESVICLECGRPFLELTEKHLIDEHRMSLEAYRQKHGYASGTALVARNQSGKPTKPSSEKLSYAEKHDLSSGDAIQDDTITCMECGKKLKSLTAAHLKHHDLTPDEYRLKWGYSLDMALMSRKHYKRMQGPLGRQSIESEE